jgi:preprotein translocase subunit SecG
MQTVLLVIHLFIALALIGFVLMQRSEGGALGIGSAGAGSLFSARGVGNALTRTTAVLAVVFFITSIALTLVARHSSGGGSLFDRPAAQPAQQQQPATDSGSENNVLPKPPGAPESKPSETKPPAPQ